MTNRRVGAEMPGQIQRQLHARRKFRKALVDAELEVEGAVLVTQHDRGRHRRVAGAQRHDLALAGLRERRGGAADKGRIAGVLSERGAALALPAAGFQLQEGLERRGDIAWLAGDVELDGAVLGEAVALAAQLLQFLGAERFLQQFVGIAGGVETGADMRLQHGRLHAVAPQDICEGFHGGAVERHVAQDQRMGAGSPRLLHQAGGGVFRQFAIERRRRQRAVGIGADQRGQGNLVGAPHRNHGHQPDQFGGVAPRAERGGAAAAAGGSVHRQLPVGQIIAVGFSWRVRTARATTARECRQAASARRRRLPPAHAFGWHP